MKLKHKRLINRLIVAGILLLLIIIFSLIKNNTFISEYIFARGISRFYCFIIGNITSLLPFSLYEIFIYLLIGLVVFLILKWSYLSKKKRNSLFYKSVLNTLNFVLIIAIVSVMTTSFSYYREELPLPQYNGNLLESEEVEEITRYYLEEFQEISGQVERNENGQVISPYNYNELTEKLIEEYKRIGTFDGYYSSFTPKVKKIIASRFMCYEHFTGVAVPMTGEANVNYFTPTNYQIITMAHEIAHTKGIMIENDANLSAYYLTITSNDTYFRYAGFLYTMPRLMEIAYFTCDKETYRELYAMYPREAINERILESDFWNDYDSIIDAVSDKINDIYLKLSGVEDGVQNYRDTSTITSNQNEQTGAIEFKIKEYSPLQKMFIQLYKTA